MAPPFTGLFQRDDSSSSSASISSISSTSSTSSIPSSSSSATPSPTITLNSQYNPGLGARPADSFNNTIFLILFAVIGSLMALASLWFFTMSKHGGFHWKQTDWDDYKSTVLRRKGPDGKTLSNATRSTKLGGGSIVPKWAEDKLSTVSKSSVGDGDKSDVGGRRQKGRSATSADPEFDAYRYEKPAGVGGLNKPAEGSHYDYTSTKPSTLSAPNHKMTRKERRDQAKREKEQKKNVPKKAAQPPPPPSNVQSASTHPTGSYYVVPQDSPSSQNRVRFSTPRAGHTFRAVNDDSPSQTLNQAYRNSAERGSPQRRSYRPTESAFSAATNETGARSFPHSIPGLTKGEVGIHESISQVGTNQPPAKRYGNNNGYRRGEN